MRTPSLSAPRRRLLAATLCACSAAWAAPVWADVIEIGPGGAVAVYAAPAVFTAEGATPIAPARPSPASRQDIARMIAETSQRYALPASIMQAVAWRESRYRQDAISPKGAIGVMQLMGGTARDLGVNPYDLRQNIEGGAAYLSRMLTRYGGDTALALAAYDAGPGAVDRHGAAPPFNETRRYVAAIMAEIPSADAMLASSPLIFGR